MENEKFVSLKFIKWLNKYYTNFGSINGTFTKIGRWREIGSFDGKSYTTMQLHKKYTNNLTEKK